MISNSKNQEKDNNVLLSIVIPTLGTRDKLEPLLNDIQEQLINSSFIKSRSEVLLFINNESPEIFNKWQSVCSSHIGTKIVRAEQHKISAEQSAFHAATQASGKYVWWIGDDDDILPHAIDSIFQSLISYEPSFILFNCLIETQSKTSKYYSLPYTECSMEGLDLYKKLGFMSATTLLSCLCINRQLINMVDFEIFHDILPAYSHPVYLFTTVYDKKAVAVDYPVVCKKAFINNKVRQSISKFYPSSEKKLDYLFIEKLIKQLKIAAEITQQEFLKLFNFQEIEFNTISHTLAYSSTGSLIKRLPQTFEQEAPAYVQHFVIDPILFHSGNNFQSIPTEVFFIRKSKKIDSKEKNFIFQNTIINQKTKHKYSYYIFAPDFISTSAGIKALYILCDRLNAHGYPAYMISNKTTDTLNAPLLSIKEYKKQLRKMGKPIVIYPEVIPGNPLRARFYIRYYLCFHGHFGVDLSKDKANMVYAFSKDICDDFLQTDNILFVPTIDLSIFYPPKEPIKRKGACYAAMKYKIFHKKEVYGLPEDCIEITRNLPGSQSKEEIAELFRQSKYFYCFDNSALALEATLCGCITILMKNNHFTHVIGEHELNGLPGMAWCDDEEGIAKAEKTIENAYDNYLKVIDNFENNIDNFIRTTQEAIQKKVTHPKILKMLNALGIRKLYNKIMIKSSFLSKSLRKAVTIIKNSG